jgi:phospholipase/lecithinase/hemolysin
MTYSEIYSFGDSLSDAGNAWLLTKSQFASLAGLSPEPVSPPYFAESYNTVNADVFSNGPVWTQDLASALGLGTLAPSGVGAFADNVRSALTPVIGNTAASIAVVALEAAAGVSGSDPYIQLVAGAKNGTDFAVGGALTGPTNENSSTSALDGLDAQLQTFQHNVGTPAANALATVSIGGNDVINLIEDSNFATLYGTGTTIANVGTTQAGEDVAQSVSIEAGFLGSLVALGVPNIVVMNVPDIGKTPEATADGASQAAAGTVLSNYYNNLLSADIASLNTGGANISIDDAFSLIDSAVADPASDNLQNVTAPVYSGTLTSFTPADLVSSDPAMQDSYLFFDKEHPTETGESGLGQLAQADVTSGSAGAVTSAYLGIYRTIPTEAFVTQTAAQIDSGASTVADFDNGLIGSEQAMYSTLPALVTINAFYNATPTTSELTATAASTGAPSQIGGFYSAQYLHDVGASDPNVWTIMASQWGADPNSAFYQQFSSYATDPGLLIATLYKQEFGFAPSSANLQNLLNDVPGVQALLAGGGSAATPIQVDSGIYGYLLYVGQTTPSLPTLYAADANAFLLAAANGTAKYGTDLTAQSSMIAPGPTPTEPGLSGSVMSSAAADPNVITVTSSDQLIDPGVGNFSIQFQSGSSADTLVLHSGGVDQVSGFDPASDVLNVSSLLVGTGLGLAGDIANLSGYLSVADQGTNAVVRFDPTGQGGGSTVAVLQGLGGVVAGLGDLHVQSAVQVA